jgi:hypothetical protein
MTSPIGGFILIVAAAGLAGCISPMSTREAEDIAHARLDKYCAGRCGAVTLAHTQKIKDRWHERERGATR